MLGGGRFEGEAPPGFAGVLMLDLEIDLERDPFLLNQRTRSSSLSEWGIWSFVRRRSRLGWLRSLARRRAVELVFDVILSASIGRWRPVRAFRGHVKGPSWLNSCPPERTSA